MLPSHHPSFEIQTRFRVFPGRCFGTSGTLGRFGALTDVMADQTRFKGHGIRDRVILALRYQSLGADGVAQELETYQFK